MGIRKYMLVGMLTFFALPVLAYTMTDVLDQHVFRPPAGQQREQHDAALRDIAGSATNWRDPAWQATARAMLSALGVGALIRDPSGAEVFRSGNVESGSRWSG